MTQDGQASAIQVLKAKIDKYGICDICNHRKREFHWTEKNERKPTI